MSSSVSVRLLSTQSDARLLALARQGHERAFEALVQRHRRALLGYCRRVLLPDSRAEDALQQGLLQAWIALQNGTDVRDARAWLYRVVHNAALNTLRGSGYDYAELTEALSGGDAPHEDLDRRIAVREALAGLAALPPLQRDALLQTAVEGHSHEQVAAAMGLSEGALRGLVYRARVTLRTAATAITPTPLVSWAVGAGSHGGSLADLAVSGGSAGLGSLMLKGGAAAVTAAVIATGAGTVGHHRHHTVHRAPTLGVAATDLAVPAASDQEPSGSTEAGRRSERGAAPSPSRHGSSRPGHRAARRHRLLAASPVMFTPHEHGMRDERGEHEHRGRDQRIVHREGNDDSHRPGGEAWTRDGEGGHGDHGYTGTGGRHGDDAPGPAPLDGSG